MNIIIPQWTDWLLPGPRLGIKGRIRPSVVDAKSGLVLHDLGWSRNMILDGGLDMIASNYIANCFLYGHIGYGSDSVVASQSRLNNWAKRTSTYGAGDGAMIYNGDVVTFQRSFLFSEESGTVTYNEFGSSPTNVDDPPLFNRVVLPGGLVVGAGQRVKITLAVDVTFSPHMTPAVYEEDIISGWAGSSGQFRIIAFEYGGYGNFGRITANGTTDSYFRPALEPASASGAYLGVSSTSTLAAAADIAQGPYASSTSATVGSLQSYTPGSGTRIKTLIADLNDCNVSNIRSIQNWQRPSSYPSYAAAFQLLLDNAFVKENTHRLTLNFNFSWGRA